MIFTAHFYNETGLTPKIYLYKVSDKSLVANGIDMEEIAVGWYKYDFSAFDVDEAYVGLADRTSGDVSSRYAPLYTTVHGDVAFIRSMEEGKWEVIGNQMIFYKPDGITEVIRFNLFNQAGDPAMEKVFKRVKV